MQFSQMLQCAIHYIVLHATDRSKVLLLTSVFSIFLHDQHSNKVEIQTINNLIQRHQNQYGKFTAVLSPVQSALWKIRISLCSGRCSNLVLLHQRNRCVHLMALKPTQPVVPFSMDSSNLLLFKIWNKSVSSSFEGVKRERSKAPTPRTTFSFQFPGGEVGSYIKHFRA